MTLTLRDDRGRKLFFERIPQRIVSLVPSDTYSLARLGAGARLVGRTRYCVEPAGEVAALPEVGGTKSCDVEKVLALAPDVVVANLEENGRKDVEAIEAAGVPVLASFPVRFSEGVAHVARLARLLGFEQGAEGPEAKRARELVRDAYRALPEPPTAGGPRVFVAIWDEPLMTANDETFLASVIEAAGGENVFATRKRLFPLTADLGSGPAYPPERTEGKDTRYPRVTLEEVRAARPDVVLLPDEPFAFGAEHAERFRRALGCRVELVDGKDLTWYGVRAVEGLDRVRAWVGG